MKKTSKYVGLIRDRPNVVVMAGRKGSGKTQLLVRLLRDKEGYRGVFDEVILISPTYHLQKIWSTISKEGVTVHDSFSTDTLEQIYNDKQKNPSRKSLLILDDNGEDLKKINQSIFNKLISNSRHVNLSMVVLCQKITQCPTILRAQADTFCVFSATSTRETDQLHAEIGILDKKTFEKVFRSATGDRYSFFCCSMIEGQLRFYKNFETEYK